jgi:Flp pilus assembly protein TadD
MGRYREAETAFRKAIRIDPSYPNARNNLEKLLGN